MAKRTKDEFTRDWIIENSVEILSRYEPGVLTIRALHYQLVSIGMTNTLQHYKRVVSAMEVARWDGRVDFEAFSDRDRAMCGETKAEPTDLEEKQDEAKAQVRAWRIWKRKAVANAYVCFCVGCAATVPRLTLDCGRFATPVI